MSPETFTRAVIPRLSGAAHDPAHEQARREGHALGHAEGMRRAHDELRRRVEETARREQAAAERAAADAAVAGEALGRAAAAFDARAAELADISEARIIAYAIDLAELILERELSESVSAALTAAHRARLALDADRESAVVVLHPDDLATLTALGERVDERASVGVDASPELAPGDALVRFPDGEIDLRVAAALARARAALTESGR